MRRREGLETVSYPKPELEAVLSKTLGVPLFQEQAMRLAIVCAGFTPGEADQLRRAMATFKFTGGVSHFRAKLIDGMVANGYEPDFAERTFKQLEGFGSYGFPESHAASFALISYASSWMKCWHPDVFCAALLNAQPMGFYAPAQIVRDAQRARGGGSAALREPVPLGLHPGAHGQRRTALRSASACAWPRAFERTTPPRSWWPGPTSPTPRSRSWPAAPAPPSRRWSAWPTPTPSSRD